MSIKLGSSLLAGNLDKNIYPSKDEMNELFSYSVKLDGDQDINGVKTFNDNLYAPNQIDYSRITNCITYIPQDIKLEFNFNPFVQPTLTENGTMGGNSFACDQSTFYTEDNGEKQEAWRVFDGNKSIHEWQVNTVNLDTWYWLSWYNPSPIKISKVGVMNSAGEYSLLAWKLQGSNNNSTWTDLTTGTNDNVSSTTTWYMEIPNEKQGFYKYYRIYCQPRTTTALMIRQISIDATQKALVLKAGSKVYVPNGKNADGSNKFDEVVISKDLTYSQGYNDTRPLMVNAGGTIINGYPVAQTFSGSTTPTGSTYMFWYDTTNNIIKETHDSGVTWSSTKYSFPFCIIKGGSDIVESINQIFNGFGYIGSTVFALPGVKGLIPDGRNTDGSLRNIGFVNPVVRTHSVTGTHNNVKTVLATMGIGVYYYAYDDIKNAIYRTDTGAYYSSDRFIVADISFTNGVITSFTPKTTFHAVDYNDYTKDLDTKVNKSGDTMTGNLKIQGGATQHVVQCISNLLMSETPTANTGVGKFQVLDKEGNYLMQVGCERYTDGRTSAFIRAHSPTNDDNSASISVNFSRDGTISTAAPTPATGDNSTKIATTAWVNNSKSTIVGWGMPNYSAGVSKGWKAFTADKDGWIYCYSQVNNNRTYVYINGKEVYSCYNNNYADGCGAFVPINKGDNVTVGGTVFNTSYITFYPCKGA